MLIGLLYQHHAVDLGPEGLLLATLAMPLVGLLLIVTQPAKHPTRARNAALLASLATMLLTAGLVAMHLVNPATLANLAPFSGDLTPLIHSKFALGVDGLSIWLIALTAVLVPAAVLASSHSIRTHANVFYALLMLLETAMLGVFAARDLLWFYIFFEFTLIPLFFVIGIWGGPDRRRAAFTFFIFTLAGTLITLATFLYMAVQCKLDFSFAALATTLPHLPTDVQVILFTGLFIGLAIKVPLFPLHTWLPLAHTEAPTAGSVLLAGVLLKLGTYGFLRIGLGWLPKAAILASPAMGVLAVIGILYGALAAWVQGDFKRLIAYSSIAHLGFCMLGMFSMDLAGLTGSLLVMINHGLSTGALFLVAGMIYDRYHTRRFNELGGLAGRMPVIAFFFVFFALSSLGLPGLNGFVGEFLVLLGSAQGYTAWTFNGGSLGWSLTIAAALGVVLSAVYLLSLVGRLMFGPLVEPEVHHEPDEPILPPDATGREWAILAPLAALVLLLGIWPAPITRSISEPAQALLNQVKASCQEPDVAQRNPTSAPDIFNRALTDISRKRLRENLSSIEKAIEAYNRECAAYPDSSSHATSQPVGSQPDDSRSNGANP
jgi:NADH-quinone oxidoreductase subunit M